MPRLRLSLSLVLLTAPVAAQDVVPRFDVSAAEAMALGGRVLDLELSAEGHGSKRFTLVVSEAVSYTHLTLPTILLV